MVRKDSTRPNTYHLLTNAFFARDTVQQDLLTIDVPVPPRPPPKANGAGWSLTCTTPLRRIAGGCDATTDRGIRSIDVKPVTNALGADACRITIVREPSTEAALSDPICSQGTRAGDIPTCPCNDTAACANIGLDTFSHVPDLCHPMAVNGSSDGTTIAFAGDIRAEWVDPVDLWQCPCDCEDPSAPGATMRATVQGCADPGFEFEEPESREEACEQVCGGTIVGQAPHMRLGVCRPVVGDPVGAWVVSRGGCTPPGPSIRVSPAADYRVTLLPTSMLEVGTLPDGGTFTAVARSITTGSISVNQTSTGIEVTQFLLSPADFVAGNISVRGARAFNLNRFTGTPNAAGKFEVPSGTAMLGARAVIDNIGVATEFQTEGPMELDVNLSAGFFSMEGSARDDAANAVNLKVIGFISNHPPVARPQTAVDVVECSSPLGTPVTLVGTTSSDPDHQVIAHYQWFEGNTGLSNTEVVTPAVALGQHEFRLHVYDAELASHSAPLRVSIVDTTPPTLTVSPEETCLWPPNHAFARFTLGREISYSAVDACDSAPPRVEIESIVPTEPEDALGSGSTSPDWIHGKHVACVRAERQGGGNGRRYEVTLVAFDSHGNARRRAIQVVVPHDQSGSPGCQRADGIDQLDDSCRQ